MVLYAYGTGIRSSTRVTEATQRLRQGRTTIVIAHRLFTVIEADQIAVIEDGRVGESGPPEELARSPGPTSRGQASRINREATRAHQAHGGRAWLDR
jgi:ABC-type multidrug transport system ATPase subunit